MGIKSFFKKPTGDDVLLGRIEAGYYIGLGHEAVNERSTKWFKFFSWMGPVGTMVFYIEGRREQKRKEETGGTLPKLLRIRHERAEKEKKRGRKRKEKERRKKWKKEQKQRSRLEDGAGGAGDDEKGGTKDG